MLMYGTEPLVRAMKVGNSTGAKKWRQLAVNKNNWKQEDSYLVSKVV